MDLSDAYSGRPRTHNFPDEIAVVGEPGVADGSRHARQGCRCSPAFLWRRRDCASCREENGSQRFLVIAFQP